MKNIIRLFAMFVVMMAFSVTMVAQKKADQRMSREQLAEVQAKHIAKDLGFDDATSKKFIETYGNCQKEIWNLGPRRGAKSKSLTDSETDQAMKERFSHSRKILEIREKYYNEYSKFLTPKQIQRVYESEKKMMDRLSKHKRGSQRSR